MMTTDRPGHPSERLHAVRFYQDDGSLCRMVADFVGQGFENGQPALVFATAPHRAEILRALADRRIDVNGLMDRHELRLYDAEEMLSKVLVDESVDASLFRKHIGGLIEHSQHEHPGSVTRVYGELVNLLWRNGQQQSAVRLEMLWNQLAAASSFSLLCSYSMGEFYKDAAFDDICREHTHVVSEDGAVLGIEAAQGPTR